MALLTTFSGGRSYVSVSSGLACDICQFWQNLQLRTHPAVAIEKAVVPGKKWKKGFFSIGSI
jgi:hypothetical protein